MAISLGGGKKKSKNKSKGSQESGTVGSTTTTGLQQGISTGAILDPETIARLQGANAEAGGAFSEGVNQTSENLAFADSVRDRALGLEDTLRSDNAAIINAAQLQGEERLATEQGRFAAGAGSAINTLAQGQFNRSNIQLSSQLAGVEGGLNLQASQAGTQALNSGLAGNLAAAQGAQAPLLSTAQLLKGATSVNETSQFNLSDTLKALTNKGKNESEGSGSGTEGNFGISL